MQNRKVVIIGGGFGGLYAAKQFSKHGSSDFDVTVLDKRNFHLFQPLLYQVATGSLAPGNIASPLRRILRSKSNLRVLQSEVFNINPVRKVVITDNEEILYDTVIVATGVHHSYFGHDDWAAFAPGLKTVEDAVEIRRRILLAFELAERENDPTSRAALLTFVIVGGGPTGVELAGALTELAKGTLQGEFRSFDSKDARIILVEGAPRILNSYSAASSLAAQKTLEKMGVLVLTETTAIDINERFVLLKPKNSDPVKLETSTVLWAAGIKASSFAEAFAASTGAQQDRSGRIIVNPDCSISNYPDIFVIGDLAFFDAGNGKSLPGVAPVAMQQARYVTALVCKNASADTRKPFRYRDRGSMAVIGRNKAVIELGRFKCSGFFAWLIWMCVHIFFLIEFKNKFSVVTQWAFTYFTNGRGSRLITGNYAASSPKDLG